MAITPIEAAKVLAHIAMLHRRTAPKVTDDAERGALCAAWAAACNRHDLDLPDLLAAVIQRAADEPQAPEPAELIAVARRIRADRVARTEIGQRSERAAELDARIDRREQLAELIRGDANRRSLENAGAGRASTESQDRPARAETDETASPRVHVPRNPQNGSQGRNEPRGDVA